MIKFFWTTVTVLVMVLVFHTYANAQEYSPQWEIIGKSGHGEGVFIDIKSARAQKEPKYSSAWFRFLSDKEDIQIRFYSTLDEKAVCYDMMRIDGKLYFVADKPCLLVQKESVGFEIFKSLVIVYMIFDEKSKQNK